MNTIARATRRTIAGLVADRADFNGSNVSGRTSIGGRTELGELPVKYWNDFRAAEAAPDFYVVKSYITPIAWFADGVWYVPNVNYSPTTSRHLSSLSLGLDHGGSQGRDYVAVR